MVTIRSGLVGTVDPYAPELPQLTVDTTYSLPTGGTTRTVGVGMDYTDLQVAIDAAVLGDILVLTAGETFTDNFTLPDKGAGTDWIYIISSDLASLAEGTRVVPGDATSMAAIATPNTSAAVDVDYGGHHYRFAGIEFTTNFATYNLIMLGTEGGVQATTEADLAWHITFDRCYIHSINDSLRLRTGLLANGKYIGVVDSYFQNCKDTADAQAIAVWQGTGPFKIHNNFLEGSGENILFGGEAVPITNALPSDVTFTNNHCFKRLAWNGGSWGVKNLFEIKMGQRFLISGNVFENVWVAGQNGTAIVLTVRDQYGDAEHAIIQDVTFENNLIHNVGRGLLLTGEDDLQISQQTQRVLIRNNVFDEINAANGGAFTIGIETTSPDRPILYLTIENNLIVYPEDEVGYNPGAFNAATLDGFIFRNNIFTEGDYGAVIGTGQLNYTTEYNGVIFNPSSSRYTYNLNNYATRYPGPGMQKADVPADADFTDWTAENYLLLNTSPFYQAGSDGKDMGPDIAELNAAIAGVT